MPSIWIRNSMRWINFELGLFIHLHDGCVKFLNYNGGFGKMISVLDFSNRWKVYEFGHLVFVENPEWHLVLCILVN